MIRQLATFAATALLATAAFAATIGEAAPAFKGINVINGKEVTNEALKGKIVVLEWNNFGCPFVKKFYGSSHMQQLQADAVKDGVVWVTINSSAPGKEGHLKDANEAKAAIATNKLNSSAYLLDHDGTLGHAYGAKSTPHMYVINKDGILVYQGAIDNKPTPDVADINGASNYVVEALRALKEGKPIKTASTQAYGCAVKYQ